MLSAKVLGKLVEVEWVEYGLVQALWAEVELIDSTVRFECDQRRMKGVFRAFRPNLDRDMSICTDMDRWLAGVIRTATMLGHYRWTVVRATDE